MSRIAYVDGQYVPHRHAQVAMEDRGYQFADGVYEVIVFFNRRSLDEALHLKRLAHSLMALHITPPMADAALKLVMRELIARNAYTNGFIYLQVTRGVAPRNHPFPKHTKPVLTMSVMRAKEPTQKEVEEGVAVITAPDIRWGRCDIKSISLLPNILAKQEATARGAREAVLYNAQGQVTEASHSNFFMVKGGTIITHPQDNHILNGVRRQVLHRLAASAQIEWQDEYYSLDELKTADEAFLTSATGNVLPVTMIDDHKVGNGKVGAITQRLSELYREHVSKQTGKQWS